MLIDLIVNDLTIVCSIDSKAVLSEESIRLMLKAHEDRLVNLMLIHEKSVPELLQKISRNKKKNHYQLFIEVGSRSLMHQGVPECIHYSAMDVFCSETGAIVAFIADHYQGKEYHSYRAIYETLQLEDIHFIVAGGTSHQTDGKSCPIFTLSHLLLTAHDVQLHEQLIEIACASTERMIKLPWFGLNPSYNISTQSFTSLTSYVDHIKQTEALPPEVESTILRAARFDEVLTNKFQQVQSKSGKDLIINKNIESQSIDYASATLLFMQSGITEELLVEYCYRDKYPLIADMLQYSLQISRETGMDNDNLFAFIFSNQPFLNYLLEDFVHAKKVKGQKTDNPNQKMYLLMINRSLIVLIQRRYIDPFELFMFLTDKSDSKICKLLEKKVSSLYKQGIDSQFFSHLINYMDNYPDFNPNLMTTSLIKLLFIPNIVNLFKIEKIRNLYFSGKLSDIDFTVTRFNQLNLNSLADMSEDQIIRILVLTSPSPISVGKSFSPAVGNINAFFPAIKESSGDLDFNYIKENLEIKYE